MEFIVDFRGVQAGDVYPTYFVAGQECPPELEAAALDIGAIAKPDPDESPEPEPEVETQQKKRQTAAKSKRSTAAQSGTKAE